VESEGEMYKMNQNLHRRLVALQTEEELLRKMRKAASGVGIWTREDIDWTERQAIEFGTIFVPDDEKPIELF